MFSTMTIKQNKETKTVQIGVKITPSKKEYVDKICKIETKHAAQVISDALNIYLTLYPTIRLIQTSVVDEKISLNAEEIGDRVISLIKTPISYKNIGEEK